MGSTFQRLHVDRRRVPGWALQDGGEAFQTTLGMAKDRSLAAHTQKLHASYPTFAPSIEILKEQARDRHVLSFPGETRAGLEERVRGWLDSNREAGLPYGIMREVQLMWAPAVPRIRLVQGISTFAAWYTLEADGTFSYVARDPSNWDWDSAWALGAPEPVSIHRFFVIVYAPDGVEAHPVSSDPHDDQTWGSPQVSPQFGLAVRQTSLFMRSAGSQAWGWILAFDPTSFDPDLDNGSVPGGYPDGTWFRAYKLGGEWNRLQTARYYCIRPPIPSP